MNFKHIAENLLSKYVWHVNDFDADTLPDIHIFRYLIACIIVAGSSEDKTFAVTTSLFKKYPWPSDLALAPIDDILEIFKNHDIDYAKRKTRFLKETTDIVNYRYNGQVPDTREKLEALPGVGRHIASVILATIHSKNEFAVDFHVRRIFKRLNLIEKGSDKKYEEYVAKHIKPEHFGHLSRAFVDFGQDICTASPRCNLCSIIECPSRKITNHEQGLARQQFEAISFTSNSAPDKTYVVTVRGGQLQCTCKAGRYRKKCKHITQVEENV